MSKTNRAFIKAYRQDAAQRGPTAPAIAGKPAVPMTAGTLQASAAGVSTATNERSALYGPRPAVAIEVEEQPSPIAADLAPAKKPLSSFIARPLKSPPEGRTASDEFLRPGTTVASFQWPAVCRAISQRCGRQLDDVAAQLAKEAAGGRSLIGVVGLFAGRGTTTAALCLAARLARRDRRVILVDGNFCNPRLAAWLEAVPTAGWQDVLKRGIPLADAVVRAQDDHLDLLALNNKPTPDDAQRLVGGLQAVVTAGVLRHAYDVVLFDCGTFLDSVSQPIVLELVRNTGIDAVVAVTGTEPADPRDLKNLNSQLSRSGCELLGTIENRIISESRTF